MSRKLLTKLVNRNPRNLEMLGLQAPSLGYDLEKNRLQRSFIYKASLLRKSNHLVAQVQHYRDGPVVTASSNEKGISSQLYSKADTSAAMNLGRVLAVRCLMSGIHFAVPADSEETIGRSQHLKAFYKTLADEGLILSELPHKEHTYSSDRRFTYDRYEIHHTKVDKTDEL